MGVQLSETVKKQLLTNFKISQIRYHETQEKIKREILLLEEEARTMGATDLPIGNPEELYIKSN